MESHVDRMKQEHKELMARLNALDIFIRGSRQFLKLNFLEQSNMRRQATAMEAYASALASRLFHATQD